MDGPSVALRQQAAVLEEDVHELPQHVVQGLDQLLADVRVGGRGHELVLGAGRGEGERETATPAPQLEGSRRLSPVVLHVERHHDVLGPGEELQLLGGRPAFAGQTDGGKRALADDHGVHELDGDMTRVRAPGGRRTDGDQAAAAREALGHAVAQPCQPLGLRGEEARVGVGALVEHPLDVPVKRHA